MKLTEAIQINEAKFSEPIIAYHGTKYENLQTILSQGLVASRSGSGWGSSIGGNENQKDKKAVGGVYFTTSPHTAMRATRGEKKLLVIAQVQPRSSYSDEDDIDMDLERAMKRTVNTNSMDIMLTEYLVLRDMPDSQTDKMVDVFVDNLEGRYQDLLSRNTGYNDLIKDYIYTGLQRILAQKFSRIDNPFLSMNRVHGNIRSLYNVDRDDAMAFVKDEVENFMSAPRAEIEHKKVIEDMTIALKRTAYDSNYMDRISTLTGRTFRIDEDITYRGANKILAISVMNSMDSIEDVVYGEIPSSAYSQLEDNGMIRGYDYEA